MEHKKIPISKLKRAAITGMTTARIGLKQLSHLSKKPFYQTHNSNQQQIQHEQEIGRILINTLMHLRGTALKVAQMMSMELEMLPDAIRVELAKACSQVTPLNRAHIRKVFIGEFEHPPETVFSKFESSAFAAASLGQVHKATTKNKKTLAVKIQYPGIAASIQSDVQLVRSIMKPLAMSNSFLPRYEIIDLVLTNIQKQLENEVDYQLEAENTRWFAKHLKLADISVATVYPQYSGTKVLTTEYIKGTHIDQWLENDPDQTERNHYGQKLFDLFCYQLHELKVLHADPHPGNIIFCENGCIALIDFGCVHTLQSDFPNTITRLFSRKPRQLYQIYNELSIISHDLSYAQFELEFFPVINEMIGWMTAPFQSKSFDFATMPPVPKRHFSKMKKAVKLINGMQQDQLYFDKSYFGLLSMLRKLRANINTQGLLLHHY